MPLPKHIREYVERKLTDYRTKRVPKHVRDRIKVGFQIRGNSVTLFEERPHFQNPSHWIKIVVAQFRYNKHNGQWSLVDADPTGTFWA